MNCKAILSNKAHPEYGQATVPFPIPDSEYDHTIGLLEDMGIGSPTAQDCQVDKLDSPYPVLNRLAAQNANVDELDYLAGRLDSFSEGEAEKFQAMASRLCLSDIKDFINLTFCCQQATVISDFSDLERAGKNHALTINGGMMPTSEFNRVNGQAVALDLIQSGAGIVTPYGVVYDNGMRLEQVYDGRHFPEYHYEPCVASVALSPPGQDGRETLCLPCPDIKIARALQRLDVKDSSQCTAVLDTGDICDAVRKVFEEEFKLNEHLDALNRLARCYQGFKDDELEKFHTVFDHAWPQTPEEAAYLAENLRDFTVINGISTAGEYGQIIAERMEVSPELAEFLDLRRLGQRQIDEEGGEFGDRGYVAYKGTQPEIKEILGRHIPPTQEEIGPVMC